MFQCSELTSAQCGMVRAKGVVTTISGGPQVTSGLRSTSDPSDCRLPGAGGEKGGEEGKKGQPPCLRIHSPGMVFRLSQLQDPLWVAPPSGRAGLEGRHLSWIAQAYRLSLNLDSQARLWQTNPSNVKAFLGKNGTEMETCGHLTCRPQICYWNPFLPMMLHMKMTDLVILLIPSRNLYQFIHREIIFLFTIFKFWFLWYNSV